MTNELFIKIVVALVGIVLAVVNAYLVPLIKVKLGQAKFNTVISLCTNAVKAAEQICCGNANKYEFVSKYVKQYVLKFAKLQLSDEEVKLLIEGVVHEVKHEGGAVDGN